MAAGGGLLTLDAELAPEEAAAGPPGWAVAGTAAIIGAGLLGIGYAMSSGGRPSRNTEQNKQFADAVREIERRIGRRLSKDEIRRLHEALHGEENPGYHEIVDLGVSMFGGTTGSSDDSSGGTGAGLGSGGSGGGDDSSGGSGDGS
jgi:hypothetical protein